MISVHEAMGLLVYTKEEQRAIDKLEAAIDCAIADPKKFTGGTMVIEFTEAISSRIANAIRKRYESEGNWRVVVEQGQRPVLESLPPDGWDGSAADWAKTHTVQQKYTRYSLMPLFFTPPPSALKRHGEVKLPSVVQASTASAPVAGQKRLLVRMPTRGRPAQALAVLEKYRTMAGAPVAIEVVIDRDDDKMMACDVLQRLVALDCQVTVGKHGSKVKACNGGHRDDWDILVLASDDMVPVADGYAQRVLQAMERHFPFLDGAIYFDDGYQGSNLCTLPIIGSRLHWQFQRYVYDPSYESLFCDTEQTALLSAMKRLVYVDEKLIMHKHPAWGAAQKDALYERNDTFWDRDKKTFELRQKSFQPSGQFPFNAPPLRLSLCVASLPERRSQLERLLAHLWRQIIFSLTEVEPRGVEVLVDDRSGPTIGEKRQALIERALGHYVAFIDDDDWVAHDYVERIWGAICQVPQADCVSLVGEMTTAGAAVERFEHSLRHREWSSSGGVHLRPPNHLNAVRRELALQAGFPAKNHAEDFDYSQRLRPLLRQEASAGDRPIYFYWYFPKMQAT